MARLDLAKVDIPRFDRRFFQSGRLFSRIGDGEIGGKAHGLVLASDIVAANLEAAEFPSVDVGIPTFTVLGTDVFDAFLSRNGLLDATIAELADDRIANRFQQGDLPVDVLGDLRSLVEQVHAPLAVRSSSLLEDALLHPFAGIYETKMTANNQPDPVERFRKLVEAIKFVYASTFFRAARNYVLAIDKPLGDEKMAVVIQEVVGLRHGERFYPTISGVCRSFNFYPTGSSSREAGVVDLALGLGKTIVDGGLTYTYSPAQPKATPPYASARDALKRTQRDFWAVNVGTAPPYDPIAETEYLIKADLKAAEYDGTLDDIASTYMAASDRIYPGTGHQGPRIVNFAPILVFETLPLNRLVKALLAACERALGQAVEIEFAVNLRPRRAREGRARFALLQVRPMFVPADQVDITPEELDRDDLVIASNRVMGNGVLESIRDVVYVKPDVFEARHTRTIAAQIEKLNAPLLAEGRSYLLIGFGRWGSSDPWLGIPVDWGQLSAARAIVEASLPDMMIEPSQGSHFFHNISSFQVSYFTVSHTAAPGIDWDWLERQQLVTETEFVRHVRLGAPLLVKVDGRSGCGAIWSGTDTREPDAKPSRMGDGPEG